MAHRLLLFDIDGTLIRTRADRLALEQAIARVFGFDGALEGMGMMGRTDLEIVEEALARGGVAMPGDLMRFWEVFQAALHGVLEAGCPLTVLPGVERLLEAAARRPNLHLGLVTGNARVTARTKLEHAGLWHRFSVGAFGCEHRDRAELVRIARSRAAALWGEGLRGKRVALVGDTDRDIHAARASGVRAIAVATGFSPAEELAAHSPDLVLHDFGGADTLARILDVVSLE